MKLLTELAVLAALCVLLSLLTIPIGNIHITLESLPITVAALAFGPLPAAAVALVSELLMQILSYGFTATTILWLIPPMVRALVIGFAAVSFKKRGQFWKSALFGAMCSALPPRSPPPCSTPASSGWTA